MLNFARVPAKQLFVIAASSKCVPRKAQEFTPSCDCSNISSCRCLQMKEPQKQLTNGNAQRRQSYVQSYFEYAKKYERKSKRTRQIDSRGGHTDRGVGRDRGRGGQSPYARASKDCSIMERIGYVCALLLLSLPSLPLLLLCCRTHNKNCKRNETDSSRRHSGNSGYSGYDMKRERIGAGTGRKRDQGLNVQRQSQQVEQPRRGIFKDHKTTLTDLQSERASEREREWERER